MEEIEVGITPCSSEADTGMEDGQAQGRYRDHATLEHHERGFVIGQGPVETTGQFSHAKTGSDQYR